MKSLEKQTYPCHDEEHEILPALPKAPKRPINLEDINNKLDVLINCIKGVSDMKNKVSVKIINKSSREIPEEIVNDDILFGNMSELQRILEEYNLRLYSYERVYNDDKELSEQIITIDDIK